MSERRPMVLECLRMTHSDAREFAVDAHQGQIDKAGDAYINHIARVVKSVGRLMFMHGHASDSRELDEAVQIAWLHDALEDTDVTASDLIEEGFAPTVVEGVKHLTNDATGNWPYIQWIEWLAKNASLPTLLVKIADVEDNSDPDRLALLPTETRARLEKKYGAALPVLKAAAERLGWKEERSNVR